MNGELLGWAAVCLTVGTKRRQWNYARQNRCRQTASQSSTRLQCGTAHVIVGQHLPEAGAGRMNASRTTAINKHNTTLTCRPPAAACTSLPAAVRMRLQTLSLLAVLLVCFSEPQIVAAQQRERPVLFHIASDVLASQHCATTACGMAGAQNGKTLLRLFDAVAVAVTEVTACSDCAALGQLLHRRQAVSSELVTAPPEIVCYACPRSMLKTTRRK